MSLDLLKEQLRKGEVIRKKDYRYIVNPITEQEPALEPAILTDCADKLLEKLNYKKATKILTPEAMGIPIATVISLKTSIPLIIATKRKKRVLNEIVIEYTSGYEKGVLHINNIKRGDKILIIDDLISTGGTIMAMIESVRKLGAEVTDIGAIFNKVDYQGVKELGKIGFQVKTLLNVKLNENEIEVKDC
jgi:adenine phosphoribosyltransferase